MIWQTSEVGTLINRPSIASAHHISSPMWRRRQPQTIRMSGKTHSTSPTPMAAWQQTSMSSIHRRA